MPSDVMIDEVGCHVGMGRATDDNNARAERYVMTVQRGCDTKEWYEFAEAEQAAVVSTSPQLRPRAEFQELATEVARRRPNRTVPKRGEPADVKSALYLWS